MKYILVNILSITFALIAGVMALNGTEGWGWLVFAALICAHSFESSNNKNDSEKP